MQQSHSRIVIGKPGSGKSNLLIRDLIKAAEEKRFAVVCFDRPGTLAESVSGHLIKRGMTDRLYFEKVSQFKRVLQWPFFSAPIGSDPIDAANQVEKSIEEFLMLLWAKRGEQSGELKPLTRQWAENAAKVFYGLPQRPTLNYLQKLFDWGSDEFKWMLERSSAADAVREFRLLQARSFDRPATWGDTVTPSQRLCRPFSSPAVWTREGDAVDWEDLLSKKSQVYFDLSDISTEDARTLSIFGTNAILHAQRRHFDRTRTPLNTLVVLEEAGVLRLVTPAVMDGLREGRKYGFHAWAVTQSPKDFSESDQFQNLLDLCPFHYWHALSSGAETAADDLMKPAWKSDEVHYKRKRQVHNGFEEKTRHIHGKSSDETGNRIRHDTREQISMTPLYREEEDEFYKNPNLKRQEWMRLVSNLGVGEVLIRSPEGVTEEPQKTELIPEPWHNGETFLPSKGMTLTEWKTQEAIGKIWQRPIYRTPSSTPPEFFKAAPKSPTAAEKLAKRGTRKS